MGNRLEGWEKRLAAYVEERRDVPFKWNENDCVSSAAGSMVAVYGFDPMDQFRDVYKDERGARRLIARYRGLFNLVKACGCFVEKEKGFISRGDVVIVDRIEGETFMTCLGSCFMAPGEKGLEFFDSVKIKHTFEICRQS